VSKFLSLKSDPVSQPAAKDPLEHQTWCSLRIQVGNRFVSRLWDKSLEDERDALDVPAFAIAEWLIKNWWSVFNELCPGNSVPKHPLVDVAWRSWARRHCLRSADSSLFLPKLYIYTDGHNLVAESHSDRPGSLPNMPGEFLYDGTDFIDPVATEVALANFVIHTLNRVGGIDGERAARAAGQWHAIQNADVEETEFCTLAGRMGLDPYDPEEMSDHLASFFEFVLMHADDPLVRDLTEAAKPESAVAQWQWVKDAAQALRLGPRSIDLPFELPAPSVFPADYGYELARRVRASAGVEDSPVPSVEEIASAALKRTFQVMDRNHIPGQEIKAIVGQTDSGRLVAAGPEHAVVHSRRFMHARSLFHAVATIERSQRLVTGAYSVDQKASRAFAAEFLAPQRALLNRLTKSYADPNSVEILSNEFQVSAYVIQRQLENAGVPLSAD
jgi:hypothetical protein